mmetsp:Transcript_55813/g.133032  ORF Transcript_55813/g.133032 Transcript_55813/m.133032 type:complete len:219 (-) Transcript_55813:306-962(-)
MGRAWRTCHRSHIVHRAALAAIFSIILISEVRQTAVEAQDLCLLPHHLGKHLGDPLDLVLHFTVAAAVISPIQAIVHMRNLPHDLAHLLLQHRAKAPILFHLGVQWLHCNDYLYQAIFCLLCIAFKADYPAPPRTSQVPGQNGSPAPHEELLTPVSKTIIVCSEHTYEQVHQNDGKARGHGIEEDHDTKLQAGVAILQLIKIKVLQYHQAVDNIEVKV